MRWLLSDTELSSCLLQANEPAFCGRGKVQKSLTRASLRHLAGQACLVLSVSGLRQRRRPAPSYTSLRGLVAHCWRHSRRPRVDDDLIELLLELLQLFVSHVSLD